MWCALSMSVKCAELWIRISCHSAKELRIGDLRANALQTLNLDFGADSAPLFLPVVHLIFAVFRCGDHTLPTRFTLLLFDCLSAKRVGDNERRRSTPHASSSSACHIACRRNWRAQCFQLRGASTRGSLYRG